MLLYQEYLPATRGAEQELVLLHGWGCNREVWRPLLVMLRPWANITLLDLPGCAPGSASEQVPELAEVLTGILDCSPARAVYVGWSLGGQLALEIAAREPDRVAAIVTICSNPLFVAAGDWPGMDATAFSEFRGAVQADPIAALQRFDTLQVTGAEQPRQLLRQLQHLRRPPASAGLLAGLGWLETLDQRESVSALPQPQLHLLAQRDALVSCAVEHSMAALVEGIASAQVKVLAQACHLLPLAAPLELTQEIRGFLQAAGQLKGSLQPAIPEVEKREVAASFSRAAAAYDSVAQLQRDVGTQLLRCLDELQALPACILDLGCGTGYFSSSLKSRYPEAQYIGLDLASGMVAYARQRSVGRGNWLVADAEALPLASASVDLVFSSLTLQWCYRPEHLFAELARVLRPGGKCVFTSLGPDTLCELRTAWAAVDTHQHVHAFLPVSELAAAAACVPNIEMTLERRAFCMEYAHVRDLLHELKTLGAHNMNRNRPAGLTGRRALQDMLQAYETWRRAGVLPATYDVIFGVLEKA